jgi:phosphoketolase
VNVVVAGKNLGPQLLPMDEAVAHCERGIGIWDWASNDHLVMDVIERVPGLAVRHAGLRQEMAGRRCRQHTREQGEDAPAVADWVWPG